MTVESNSTMQRSTFAMYESRNLGGKAPVVTTTFDTRDAVRTTFSRQSARTPGFHDPSRTGLLAPLTFIFSKDVDYMKSGIQFSRTDPSIRPDTYGYYRSQNSGVWGVMDFYSNSDNTAFSELLAPSTLSTLDAQARNALLNKVKGTEVNVAVATAEASKTMDMVGNAAITIAGALGNLRRGDLIGAARTLGVAAPKRANARFKKAFVKDRTKALGSGWNSIAYGWRPLLDDVYGAAKELAGSSQQGVYLHSKVVKSRNVPYSFSKPWNASSGYSVRQTGSTRVSVRYGVTYMRQMGARQDLPRLGITNPALVAWELVPYSFVIDWFLPIGNWLNTFDATLGVDFINGYSTTFQLGDYSDTRNYKSSQWPDLGFTTCRMQKVRVKRVPLGSFPSVALPRLKNPASVLHLSNAMALLTNFIKK